MMKYLSARRKSIAIFCCSLFLFQLVQPLASFALTSGPSQPEVQSFQAASTTEMVDLFSGDFSYNIPLFELPGPNGGYPFNLSYQAGIGMDQEASWVGLGWILSPGAITRQMRGLPDEFRGDDVKTKMSVKPSVTVGLSAGAAFEVVGADGLSFKGGFGVSQNNYKGFGYSIDGSVGFARAAGGGMTGGIGLDFSLDSNEGISLQPSLSLSGKVGEVGLGAGYNSKSGLSNISYYSSVNYDLKGKSAKNRDGKRTDKTARTTFTSSAALSLAHPGYTPQITMPMQNVNISAEFRPGGAWWLFFGNLYARGFYNEQRLVNDGKTVTTDAYGYMNYQYASNPKAMLDFNREKDGMVTKESPNLAIPSLTYDIFSVSGQGISAMYRPMRNDYGIIYDPESSSESDGGTVGVDVGPQATHVGVNLSVNHSKSTSGLWRDNNSLLLASGKFQNKTINELYEPWYFKVHGEPATESETTLTKIGADKAVRVKLSESKSNPEAMASFEYKNITAPLPATNNASENRARKTRNQVIQTLTNDELLKGGTSEVLPFLDIKYLNGISSTTEEKYSRTGLPMNHIAAFSALTPEGLRYNYGLPAYNNRHEEVTFSANPSSVLKSKAAVHPDANFTGDTDPSFKHGSVDTDEYLRSVSIPKYAHSHLLTSIVGPDYVDLNNDGVTHDDLGYWVRFTYRKVASNYKWRHPFSKADHQEGWKSDPRDDKGSFTYGEKEIWYLAKAETKSHIAVFELGTRNDGKGVLHKIQSTDLTGAAVNKLTAIKLYSRLPNGQQNTQLKAVKFVYDESRCAGLYNETGTGKLTLTELKFEYGASTRGSLNPYRFIYSSVNPPYDPLAYDRWGNYKPNPSGQPDNRDFPYVPQNPALKAELDANASAWSLKEIELPSGGKVIVDYETDDYAYVQHKQAMQMVEIVEPGITPGASTFNLSDTYRAPGLTDDVVKVRFKLESAISSSMTAPQRQAEVMKYLDLKRKQVYFKMLVKLRKPSENYKEYISGYADIEANPATMGLEGAGGTDSPAPYQYGFFHVKTEKGNGNKRHPFSLRVWQHLRTNQPDIMLDKETKTSGGQVKQTNITGNRVAQIRGLNAIGKQLRQMFEGFYDHCANEGFGREVEVGKSWIRLNSPDKVKYGGGLRVRQITMKDQWSGDEEGVYGQVYEYTTEEDGKIISSGVASYEPIIGADENPLRYAKRYTQSVPLRADNNLFFEYPVNETYYPGPQVGYSKVTVWSLASAALATKTIAPETNIFPQGTNVSFGTTGKTEHEFYTAKDFPVITDETEKVNRPYRLSVPVPFLGSVSVSKLAASQGYSIVTNDMHGKPKKISNYRQDKKGIVEPSPISWIKYNYLSEQRDYDQERVNVLVNRLKENTDKTLSLPTPSNASLPTVILGQETEFFSDMRQFEDKTWTGGARVNTDVMYLPIAFVIVPIPVPSVWPSVNKTQNLMRTSVTNKVIFKSGILVSTEAYDGGSTMITGNEKWDKLTGVPVVTRVNNNFDDDVYNYSILAHTQYAGMGAAFQNVGLSFEISTLVKDPYKAGEYDFYATTQVKDMLYPGDEIILYDAAGEISNPLARAVYMGSFDNDNILYSPDELLQKKYKCLIVRSGFRNQLAVSAGTITALENDPSAKGTPVTHPKTITIVK